jgi:hypothetical protein
MAIESVNPATGELLRSYQAMSIAEANAVVPAGGEGQAVELANRSRCGIREFVNIKTVWVG